MKTTLSPEIIAILTRYKAIAEEQKKNWLPGFPIDLALERSHLAELAILREELKAPKLRLDDDAPTKHPTPERKAAGFLSNVLKKITSYLKAAP